MSESFKKYCQAIGVNSVNDDIILQNLAYKGFNEELPENFVYVVSENKIFYKNVDTKNTFEIHPNYRLYRQIINDYQNKKLNNLDNKESESVSNFPQIIKKTREDNKSQIDELERKLLQLDLEFKHEIDLLEDHVKNVAKSNLIDDDIVMVAELTKRYEEIEKCKKQAKNLYQICKTELEKLCVKIINIEHFSSNVLNESEINSTFESQDGFQSIDRSNLTHSFINMVDDDDSSSEDELFADKNRFSSQIHALNDEELEELSEQMRQSFPFEKLVPKINSL